MRMPRKDEDYEYGKIGWDVIVPATDALVEYNFDFTCTDDSDNYWGVTQIKNTPDAWPDALVNTFDQVHPTNAWSGDPGVITVMDRKDGLKGFQL